MGRGCLQPATPGRGAPLLGSIIGYFQCHLGGFALLEDDMVFRDALM